MTADLETYCRRRQRHGRRRWSGSAGSTSWSTMSAARSGPSPIAEYARAGDRGGDPPLAVPDAVVLPRRAAGHAEAGWRRDRQRLVGGHARRQPGALCRGQGRGERPHRLPRLRVCRARHPGGRDRARRHRGAAAAHPAQRRTAQDEQEKAWYQGIVDQTISSSLMKRYGTHGGAGGGDPVPGLRRGLLHHRRHPAGRRRRSRLTNGGRTASGKIQSHRHKAGRRKRMSDSLTNTPEVQQLLKRVAGLDQAWRQRTAEAHRPSGRDRPVPHHRGVRRAPRPSSGPR